MEYTTNFKSKSIWIYFFYKEHSMVQTRIEFEFNKKKSTCDINHVEWGVVKDSL